MPVTNNFYVYCHRRATDGICFYVGKGKGVRYKTTYSRNRYWYDIVNQYGFTTDIIINNISEQKAFELEAIVCEKIGYENLINIRTEKGWGGHSHSQETIIKLSKPVLQYTKQGKFLKEWASASDAAASLGKHSSALTECCRGFKKSSYSYIWRHKDNPIDTEAKFVPKKNKKIKKPPYCHPVDQYDLNGDFIKRWNNTKVIGDSLNIKTASISSCINNKYKSAGGFKWIRPVNTKGGNLA